MVAGNSGCREPGGRPEARVAGTSELPRRLIARAMRAIFIVFHTPAFQDDAGFGQTTKKFPAQALVAQFVVEALNMPILPRASRRDINRLDGCSFSQSWIA